LADRFGEPFEGGPARRARYLVRQFLTLRWLWAVVFGILFAIFALPTVVVGLSIGHSPIGVLWAFGLLNGATVATFVAVAVYMSLIYSGANSYLVGGMAESWTTEVLHELGPDWRFFRNTTFDLPYGSNRVADVDHIVVGPCGVVVLETKFSADRIDVTSDVLDERIEGAIQQVGRNAGRVRALLSRDAPYAFVFPALVYWGPHVTVPHSKFRISDGVRILSGADSEDWRKMMTRTARLTREEMAQICEKIDSYRESRGQPTRTQRLRQRMALVRNRRK